MINRRSQLERIAGSHALTPGSGGLGPVPCAGRSEPKRARHRHRPVDGQRRRHDVADADHFRNRHSTLVATTTAGISSSSNLGAGAVAAVAQTASEVVDLPRIAARSEATIRVAGGASLRGVGQLRAGGNRPHRAPPLSARQASVNPCAPVRCRCQSRTAGSPLRRSVVTELTQRIGDDRGRRTR